MTFLKGAVVSFLSINTPTLLQSSRTLANFICITYPVVHTDVLSISLHLDQFKINVTEGLEMSSVSDRNIIQKVIPEVLHAGLNIPSKFAFTLPFVVARSSQSDSGICNDKLLNKIATLLV